MGRSAVGIGQVGTILFIILAILILIAYFISIYKLVCIIHDKGYNTGIYWFIGIFGTPILLGFIAVGMPDKNQDKTYKYLVESLADIRGRLDQR